MKRKILNFLAQPFRNYEYWNFLIFYAPLFPIYLYYSLKARSLSYFTWANPTLQYGGFLNYSKTELLNYLPKTAIPITQLVYSDKDTLIAFPFVAKPDFGQRGVGIELIHNQHDWESYLITNNSPIQIQEYVDLPLEFGVFYYRFPEQEKGEILGITGKRFLSIQGNGKKTLKQLIIEKKRALKRKAYLFDKFHENLNDVLPKGHEIVLEEIGNHSRGTEFFDASDVATQEILNSIEAQARCIPQFYYGRWDVKTESIEAFQKGHFVTLEINGTNSEATHIYDKDYTLFDAYGKVLKKLDIQYKIATSNAERGGKTHSTWQLAKDIYHFLCSPKN